VPTQTIVFDTADGLRLEGRLTLPEELRGGAILCHPHPLFGGSMSSAIIPAVQRALEAEGWASLRFNFRGVGRSEGTFGRGVAEVRDAAAALDRIAAAVGQFQLAVVGWSFGAMVGLAAAVADARATCYVGIAPPVSERRNTALPPLPPRERLESWAGRALVLCGTRDQFCSSDDLRTWAKEISPSTLVRIYEGEDHFFSGDKRAMAADVARFVADPGGYASE
jgi:alpha/beta superfamily hydrolase